MTKSERTRQFIIEKTAPVFNQFGFEGTSLALLQEATGLTKGGLYGNFADKDEIAMEAFRYAIKKVKQQARDEMAESKTAYDKLVSLLRFYATYVFNPPVPGGCPLLNSAVEADDARPAMRRVVTEEIDGVISFIAGLVDEGKRNGEFSRDVKSRDLAHLFFCSVEGAIMVSRVSHSDAAMKAIVRQVKNILDQIRK